jgi:hypothetical protein
MQMRTVAVVGVLSALLVAESGAQAGKNAAFRVAVTNVSHTTVIAGDRISLRGRVRNVGGTAARSRLTITLRRTRSAKGGRLLATSRLGRTPPRARRTFSARMPIPASASAGRRYIFTCIRPGSRRGGGTCSVRRIRVTRSAGTPQYPTPSVSRTHR